MKPQTTLITTLGGQPQVVTFMLDLLLDRGHIIDQVVVIFLAGNLRYSQAFRQLASVFVGDRYQDRPCHLRGIDVRLGQVPLSDAYEPCDVEAIRRVFHELLAEIKTQGHSVHLGLSGGRRVMALVALAAAMQHLTPADHVWHIYTPDVLRESAKDGALLHAPSGSGVCLIEVPFVPWAAYFPGLAPLLENPTRGGQESDFGWVSTGDRSRCKRVIAELSTRQAEVLKVYTEGLSRKEIARRLSLAVSTIDTHREAIIAICEAVWGEDGLTFQPRFLQSVFKPYLDHS